MSQLVVRAMGDGDAAAVIDIYRAGIESGNATFESRVPDWSAWTAGHMSHSRLVAVMDGQVVGWAALAPVSRRDVYRGVAEVSIYVAPEAGGKGIGTRLMAALVESAEKEGIWTLQASIFEENRSSLRLHRQIGFREVGRRERIGLMSHGPYAGRWRDTILLERRSKKVGV